MRASTDRQLGFRVPAITVEAAQMETLTENIGEFQAALGPARMIRRV